ncbi:hypothetical protein DQ384_25590 [Sphaerisporangium album]|uniref:Uncharacterized protein n=1 Tax=Sphaerisporangium album TaxID=509200 RepID=A0A367FC25_9ACTN|nr:hypothetical protein [Sphaerisporangium album]RCG27898.1 hypothetical protein DQ384_25590 [Sphaerisporangium album]
MSAVPDRWPRLASLLARMPATVTGGLLPQCLLDDLTTITTGALSRGEYELRVLAVSAVSTATGTTAEALRTTLAGTPMEPPLALTVAPVCDPYDGTPAGSTAAMTLRTALTGAHAALVVVDYGDIYGHTSGHTSADTSGHRSGYVSGNTAPDGAPERLHQAAAWFSVALEHTGPDRTTLVVDGLGRARSEPVVAAAWARQRARATLRLPLSWPDEAIVPVDSALAVEAARRDGRWADEDRRASGMPGLLDRITGPLAADPAAVYTSTAVERFHAACARVSRRCTEILALDVSTAPARPGVRAGGAAQRRARLAAMAAAPLAAEVARTDITGRRPPGRAGAAARTAPCP